MYKGSSVVRFFIFREKHSPNPGGSLVGQAASPAGWVILAVLAVLPVLAAVAACDGTCPTGDRGCDCYPNGTCNGKLVCSAGVCQSALCDPGTAGCACYKNFTCDPGLRCEPDPSGPFCEEACPAGDLACACEPGDRCNGDDLVCIDGMCNSLTCPVGTRSCHCFSDGSCDDGLDCIGQVCLDSGSPTTPPKDPKCYTPCRADLDLGGGLVRPCSPEGLMEGCVGGQVCLDGTCRSAKHKDGDQGARTCQSEDDCPDFQTCIAGGCYSNCDEDSDCPDGRRCFRHVCRRVCSVDEDSCPAGDHCQSTDGQTGVCLSDVAPDASQQSVVDGSFALSDEILSFSNVHVQASVIVTNNSPQTLEFTVKKVYHTYVDSMGLHNVTDEGALAWMSIGEFGHASQARETTFLVDGGGGTKRIVFLDAAESDLSQWNGLVEVSNPSIGTQQIRISYSEVPEGKWKGTAYYFANFGDENLNGWIAAKDENMSPEAYQALLAQVGNAFIQKWGMFRKGWLTYAEFSAALNATTDGSWASKPTMDVCPWPQGACFLYDNPRGYVEYTSNRFVVPVPSGVTDQPFSMNLRVDPNAGDPTIYSGKIVTSDTLQDQGDPAVTVHFAGDPADVGACAAVSNDGMCILPVTDLSADAYTGGRLWRSAAGEACPSADYAATKRPWLISGFVGHSAEEGGDRYVYDCRTQTAPFGTSATGEDHTDLDINLAGSNPVPNGRILHRRISLVDGALVGQKHLVIIFREQFAILLGRGQSARFDSYGVLLLERQSETLEDEDYQGWQVDSAPVAPADPLTVACSPDLVSRILGDDELDAQTAGRMARGVIRGERSETPPAPLTEDDVEQVHYYCEDTGQIDGAPSGTDLSTKNECPWGSRVQYFTLRVEDDQGRQRSDCTDAALAGLDCQQDGSCQELLNQWRANGTCDIRFDPIWVCRDQGQVYCDDDRLDLRSGKIFYGDSDDTPAFLSIQASIERAFRYKTRFQNRQGRNVGFSPDICQPDSDAVPYCYDPGEIEEIQDRVDCALALFTDFHDDLSVSDRQLLGDYLTANFGRDNDNDRDGFERLNTELLVMLGDESYTQAFASRFDLAGQTQHSFEGSRFEPDGIDLSGQAGYEFYLLYQAAQYYQMALDRFYRFSPYLWESISLAESDPERNFVTQQTVTEYLDRLIRASAQKSRALSEIAKRYQSMNRPDLARIVVQRAYGGTYLESSILSQLMLKVVEISSPTLRDQIRSLVDKAARTFRMALSDMRDVYGHITDETNFFGFSQDYIPFPALDPGDTNAFTKMLAIAKQKVAVALDHEDDALATSREYDTDRASFQSELLKLEQTYENQLGDLCGTFVAEDGKVYPAIPKYAHLLAAGKALGNPCGLVGNGEIHERMGDVKLATEDLQIAIAHYQAKLDEIEIERQRLNDYCDAVNDYADLMLENAEHKESLEVKRRRWQAIQSGAQYAMDAAKDQLAAADCLTILGTSNGTNCPQKTIAYWAFQAIRVISMGTIIGARVQISKLEAEMRADDRAATQLEITHDCDYAAVDSKAKIATLSTETDALTLEMAKANYALLQTRSRVVESYNKAQRLIDQEREALDMAINVEAAHNDPNIRIYRNENIVTADQAFQAALQATYKATKVFEYYTSQSYGPMEQLFLVRMAGHGDYNLESYLWGLEDAYLAFQESYGNPDERVAVLSLRDDILDIPRVDEHYAPYSDSQRTRLLREKLLDPRLRDGHGYIVIPFNTALRALSPLTRNHKIKWVEAEIVGTDVGDMQGRIYLRQRGTGVVRSVAGDMQYYGFPERTSVINTFFNGQRFWVFSDTDVFRSYRLRDRPLVNTRWELVFNPVDEQVNQDINLSSVTDIRLYIYYTDFTAL